MAPREVTTAAAEPQVARQIQTKLQEKLQEKLNVIEEVRMDLEAAGIKVPGIVVCGEQSAGKSSVLESLTGIQFPRSEGTCTRCPAIVRLQPDPCVNGEYAVVSNDPTFGAGSVKKVDIDEIGEEIVRVTEELAPGLLISEKPIHIKVVRKTDCTFTIIDLPGITHLAPNGSEQEDIYSVTSSLVKQYIESDDMVILVVIPATSDVQNAEALKLAKRFDPEGRRTLAVLTKVDRVTENDDIKRKMDGDYVSLQLGYVAVRNRTPSELDAGISYLEARQIEERLFANHPLLKQLDRDRVGVEALLRRITDMQGKAVAKCLPALVKDLRTRIHDLKTELKAIPDVLPSHSARLRRLSTLLTDTSQQLRALIDTAQIREPQMNLSARGYEFAEAFEAGLWEDLPDFLSDEMFTLFKHQLKEYRGITLPDLTGSPIVHQAVRDAFQASLPSRSHELTQQLAELVLEATNALLDKQVGKRYPVLAKALQNETEDFVGDQRAKADAILDSLIDAEMESVLTLALNHYYEATISKVRADLRPLPPTAGQGQPAPARAASDLNDCSPEFLDRAIRASQQGQANDDYTVCNLQLICYVYVKVVLKAFAHTAWKQARMQLYVKLQREFYDRMMTLADEGNEDDLEYLMTEDPEVTSRRDKLKGSLQTFTEHLPKLEKCCRL